MSKTRRRKIAVDDKLGDMLYTAAYYLEQHLLNVHAKRVARGLRQLAETGTWSAKYFTIDLFEYPACARWTCGHSISLHAKRIGECSACAGKTHKCKAFNWKR